MTTGRGVGAVRYPADVLGPTFPARSIAWTRIVPDPAGTNDVALPRPKKPVRPTIFARYRSVGEVAENESVPSLGADEIPNGGRCRGVDRHDQRTAVGGVPGGILA